MAWFYDGKLFEETPEDYQGFVYEIVDLYNNKRYIGKKNFWKPKILPKNSKRSRRVRPRIVTGKQSLDNLQEFLRII